MIHNFNAGPSVLPQSVFKQAANAVLNFNNSGLSILEFGHRTPDFIDVMEEARKLVKELMNLDDNHEVLFLHGGASTQFMQVPMNLLDEKETAAYTDTGVWGAKAIKEASLFGKVDVVCSSKDQNYSYIPKDFAVPNDAKYLHITTNNTIYGTQWQHIPFTSNSMVADMSSDILSRQLPFNKFDLIYAGAQKNLGAAGVNIVVVNKNILGKVKRRIPTMMDYRNHIAEQSILNTPPVFAVYVCLLTLRWLKAEGGVQEMERRNNLKAEMLYSAIDQSKIFKGTAAKDDRSKMNVCFVMDNEEQEKQFLTYTQSLGIVGIKGHRSVGGFRASLYNALESSSVEVLVNAMKHFEENN
ncbi:MAG TPA: 3-phosphoserine/phosphohydroxythreonine transaminase [Ferruginibacter sp.]|nr:3-phosphoserine/phosphohydroxythreonine transaminase [Bacteroidota bacterium]MCC6692515.1 3-phosphoserine/phosphohydroxythreonine transaminase [Chitinophagaceae bacterium]HMT95062.1 3-phosphoserine/phosphohydroxythreonine transaminase [Ferruginibacter sp.]MBS1925534.1 3-phosphoserine/phosphohydroxythreonine transaminase [Bacteroidota bacterium]HMU24283.1 3-phosphoserine/phosphohydroxythreonine transaminase [Ferruginibacter sp.]